MSDATEALNLLMDRGLTMATAESLTAGGLAAAVADVPGASIALSGGVIAYQNAVKHRLLKVDQELLDAVGAVDEQVATQMARGVRQTVGADIGISTTGVAGPESHQGKSVGTVWVAISSGNAEYARRHQFSGNRADIRTQTVNAALRLVVHQLS